MSSTGLEVERKYDVPADAVVPDLTGVLDGAVTGQEEVRELVATYFDTPDLRLRASRTTLRHRAGGPRGGCSRERRVAGHRVASRARRTAGRRTAGGRTA